LRLGTEDWTGQAPEIGRGMGAADWTGFGSGSAWLLGLWVSVFGVVSCGVGLVFGFWFEGSVLVRRGVRTRCLGFGLEGSGECLSFIQKATNKDEII